MRIEHAAVWVTDIERTRRFYADYFGAVAGPRYENLARRFVSYFLTFPNGGARLELMTNPGIKEFFEVNGGYSHIAISVGSIEAVDALAARLRADEVPVISGPRRTGDGYYEAVVIDPDGNRVEITV